MSAAEASKSVVSSFQSDTWSPSDSNPRFRTALRPEQINKGLLVTQKTADHSLGFSGRAGLGLRILRLDDWKMAKMRDSSFEAVITRELATALLQGEQDLFSHDTKSLETISRPTFCFRRWHSVQAIFIVLISGLGSAGAFVATTSWTSIWLLPIMSRCLGARVEI